jgi:tRNA(fMet)-specific endonuclease VapC
MDVILLDTGVFSFLLKGDSRAQSYASRLWGRKLALSFITVAEVFQWAAVHKWDQPRIEQLEQHLQGYVILPFDIALCRLWAEIRARCRAAGHPLASQDAWIAATALRYRLTLATHDPRDLKHVQGLELISMA